MARWSASIAMMLAALAALPACQTGTLVDRQSAALTLSSDSLSLRQLQSRRFETRDEAFMLSACAGVMQDLGFTIEESSASTGLIVASKDRAAIESGQVAGQLVLGALVAALGGQGGAARDRRQRIRISLVTKPVAGNSILARATFQRVVRNSRGQVSRVETINDATIYQQFFDKLSQAVFLEAHRI